MNDSPPRPAKLAGAVPASVYLSAEALERECRSERLRRSGPGGQNRNKVETAVRFYHLPTGLVGEATERRYQAENRKIALDRLRLELALRVRTPNRVAVLPIAPDDAPLSELSAGFANAGCAVRESDAKRFALRAPDSFRWFERLIAGKPRVSPESFDYPILVAEFFDVFVAVDGRLPVAAELLRTTPSQIVRLLSAVPKCLDALNRVREERGLSRLRR